MWNSDLACVGCFIRVRSKSEVAPSPCSTSCRYAVINRFIAALNAWRRASLPARWMYDQPTQGQRSAANQVLLTLSLAAGLSTARAAQPVSIDFAAEPPRSDAPSSAPGSPYGRKIVDLRYQPASLRPGELGLKNGETLAPENLSDAMNQLASHLGRHSEMIAAMAGGRTLIFTYVDAEFDLNPNGDSANDKVAVTLRPFHLSLPLDDVGGRILPIPRGLSAKAAAVAARSPLLPTNIAVTSDRVLGTSVSGRWQSALDRDRDNDAAPQLRFSGGGTRSIDSAFYSANAHAGIVRNRATGLLRQVSTHVEGSASLEPRGSARFRSRASGGEAGVALALSSSSRLFVDARYARARQTFTGRNEATPLPTTNEQRNRLVFEAIPPRVLGFFRAAIWQENLSVRNGAASQRLVTRVGYAKEIPVGVNQSVGVEILGGAGQTWGNIQAPRRFFAGGSQGEFLYENAHAHALIVTPDGPLLRSLGHAQGGLQDAASSVRGGTHFWHVNLNLALPIPTWSQPLIPNELTDLPGPDGSPQTLKQILRAQVDRTGPNMLQSTLQLKDGLSAGEARRRATEIFSAVQPAAHFIIDQANVFAVKPLLMLDVAELNFSPNRETWVGAGFGVQLTIVTAKFDLGYMRTVSGPTFGSHGNVFARLGFERLF
jgi:hypothetical protein